MHLSYIIALHNEEEIIAQTVALLKEHLARFESATLFLMENGSTDSSPELVKSLEVHEGRVQVRSQSIPEKGIGYAHHRGMEWALNLYGPSKDHWMVLNAADLPFGFTDVDGFSKVQKENPEHCLFIGSKAHANSVVEKTILRTVMSYVYYLVRRIILGMKTKDSQGCFFIRADWGARLVPALISRDFFQLTELVYLSEKNHRAPIEFPVILSPEVRLSKVNVRRDSLRMFKKIINTKLRRDVSL